MTTVPLLPDTNLWDQTWSKVNAMFGGGGANVQLIFPFMDWTRNIPPPGYIDATAYSVVGQVPKWRAIGKYNPSDKDLYSTATKTCSTNAQSLHSLRSSSNR